MEEWYATYNLPFCDFWEWGGPVLNCAPRNNAEKNTCTVYSINCCNPNASPQQWLGDFVCAISFKNKTVGVLTSVSTTPLNPKL